MLTSKQRSFLRSKANGLDSIFQIGKGGLNENLIKQLDEALEARELIKINVLQNSDIDKKAVFHELAESLGAEEVQAIGSRFVLYRRSRENQKIVLPR